MLEKQRPRTHHVPSAEFMYRKDRSRISTRNATHLFALRVRILDNFSMSPSSLNIIPWRARWKCTPSRNVCRCWGTSPNDPTRREFLAHSRVRIRHVAHGRHSYLGTSHFVGSRSSPPPIPPLLIQPSSALSGLLSSSRLILLVFKLRLRLLVSFVFDTDAVERDNT